MTTRITVTTGNGGLLERNAQQQAAARQAALVKAQAEQAAAAGTEQQRQRRIASGLDPATGRPLPSTGSTSRLTRIDQEPAAFRSPTDESWLVPILQRPTAVQLATPAVLGPSPGGESTIIITPANRNEIYESPLQVLIPRSETSKPYVARYSYTVTVQTTNSAQSDLLIYSSASGPFGQPYAGTPASAGGIGLNGAFSCSLYKLAPTSAPVSATTDFVVQTDSIYVELDVFCGTSSFRQFSTNLYLGYLKPGAKLGNSYTLSCSASSNNSADSLTLGLDKIDADSVSMNLVTVDTTAPPNTFAPPSNGWARYALVIDKNSVSIYRAGIRCIFETLPEPIAKDFYRPRADIDLFASPGAGVSELRYGPVRLGTAPLYTSSTYTPQAIP